MDAVFLLFDRSKAVVGIEIVHSLMGVKLGLFDDFAVLVPTRSVPQFPFGLVALLAIALPTMVILKTKYSTSSTRVLVSLIQFHRYSCRIRILLD